MTITKVCKKYSITTNTSRYCERIGLIPRIPRTSGGIRGYDEGSYGWIELMKYMHKTGVKIEALIKYMALFEQGDETIDARKEIPIKQRRHLEERVTDVQRSLDTLNLRIRKYEQRLVKKEQFLKKKHNGKSCEA